MSLDERGEVGGELPRGVCTAVPENGSHPLDRLVPLVRTEGATATEGATPAVGLPTPHLRDEVGAHLSPRKTLSSTF
jgi:hypothetical protein